MSEQLKSTAQFPVHSGEEFVKFWLHEFEEHDFDYTHPEASRMEITMPYGEATFRVEGDNASIEIRCRELGDLFAVREGITHHLVELDAELANIAWSGANTPGKLPPNFKLAEVVRAERLGNNYIRMTVRGDDISSFNKTGLHFRIVRQKNPERAPIWPVMSEKGVAQWPEGEDELWDKVYTTRYFDEEKGELTFDIFIHEGGFTCEWAETNPVGQIVGLMGPGGGWYLEGEWLLMGGDETAYPVIARNLEHAGPEVSGRAIILMPSEVDFQQIQTRSNIEVTWLSREAGDDLCEAMKSADIAEDENFLIWFAASQTEARALRQYFVKDRGLNKKQVQSIAYWK